MPSPEALQTEILRVLRPQAGPAGPGLRCRSMTDRPLAQAAELITVAQGLVRDG
ncbi:hypothetical protein [Nonomuraea lactucae]|uniref:hypothetical protein n=1 Tax=Nonomuraea lactucae TaxID=2249762 RepID=UPI0013B36172|nr:hypothetical protein [Nonomuraea lactucae]